MMSELGGLGGWEVGGEVDFEFEFEFDGGMGNRGGDGDGALGKVR